MAYSYNKGFHTLMTEAGILSSKSFSAYMTDVIGFGNSQEMDVDGFTWDDDISLTYDYVQAVLKNRIKVMATYADKDSEVIPLGTEGFEILRGTLPTQKARFFWDADDYRKYLDAVSRLQIRGGNIKDNALNLLFNGMTDIKSAHELSMLYQRDQMVSHRSLTLTADNNPRGITGLTFTANVPEANVTTKTSTARWYTDASNKDTAHEGTASDPVGDVKKVIRAMKRKGWNDIIVEVDYVSWLEDMDHSGWRTAFGYQLRPELYGSGADNPDARALAVGKKVGDEDLKGMFAREIGIPAENVHFRRGLAGVEKLVGKGPDATLTRTPIRTFDANTYVFYPAGPLGTIKSAAALVPDDKAIYSEFFGGRGLIQYEYDAKSKTQDWWSELAALCVPNRPQEMFYLITVSAN